MSIKTSIFRNPDGSTTVAATVDPIEIVGADKQTLRLLAEEIVRQTAIRFVEENYAKIAELLDPAAIAEAALSPLKSRITQLIGGAMQIDPDRAKGSNRDEG